MGHVIPEAWWPFDAVLLYATEAPKTRGTYTIWRQQNPDIHQDTDPNKVNMQRRNTEAKKWLAGTELAELDTKQRYKECQQEFYQKKLFREDTKKFYHLLNKQQEVISEPPSQPVV